MGTGAEVIEEPMRSPALVAVSTLQLLLIATRGHRSYTRSELDIIFLQVGHHFFSCLETMAEYVDAQRMATGAAAHASNPSRTRAPVPFKRMRRYVKYIFVFLNPHWFFKHKCVMHRVAVGARSAFVF